MVNEDVVTLHAPVCVACGAALSACPGHAKSQDPQGFRVLWMHHHNIHLSCDPMSCDKAPQPVD